MNNYYITIRLINFKRSKYVRYAIISVKLKKLAGSLAGFLIILISPVMALAGGGLVYVNVEPGTSLNPGEQYIVSVTAFTDNSYSTKCQKCPVKIKLEDPQVNDYIAQSGNETDMDGSIYAKVISYIPGSRLIYAEVLLPSRENYTSSKNVLSYYDKMGSKPSPTAYPPTGAPPPKPTTIVLSPKPSIPGTTTYPKPLVTMTPGGPVVDPTILNDPKVKELEEKVGDLEKKLAESQKQQSALEAKLNQLLSFVKSLFPFFR